MKGLVGVVLGTCCAIVIACSASPKSAAVMPQPPPTAQDMHVAARPNSPEADKIDALVADIDQARGSMQLPEQHGNRALAPRTSGMSGGSAPVAPTANMTCEPKGQGDTCKQMCTLSDSICVNAKKICDIAGEMAGDDWAAQKCADGNATCDAAKKKCCECMP
jgi:hypothetical protein